MIRIVLKLLKEEIDELEECLRELPADLQPLFTVYRKRLQLLRLKYKLLSRLFRH